VKVVLGDEGLGLEDGLLQLLGGSLEGNKNEDIGCNMGRE